MFRKFQMLIFLVSAISHTVNAGIQSVVTDPYGEPTVEPVGQRFLFGGKEREHGAFISFSVQKQKGAYIRKTLK